jgi:hypothetical protein
MHVQTRTLPNLRRAWEAAEAALLAPIRGAQRLAGEFLSLAMRLATSARNGACNGIVDLLDAGSGAATLAIRTGSQPTNVGDADTGTLLATLTFSDPAFGNASSGTAAAGTITSDTNVDASGTAGHFRAKDSDANIVFDGTCGQGSGDLSWDNTTFVAGGTAAVSSFEVTVPVS